MSTPLTQRIARNTAWFTAGSLLQKMISFVYFTVIAMAFGVTGTGRYFFALTFTTLFAIVADWGISPTLTREFAKDRAVGSALLPQAVVVKSAGACLAAMLALGVAQLAGYPAVTQYMIAVAVVAMVADSMHQGLYGILRGLQRVHYEAIGVVVGQLVLTMSGIVILLIVGGLRVATWSPMTLTLQRDVSPMLLLVPYVLTSITNIIAGVVGCVRERVAMPSLRVTRDRVVQLLRIATPFAITAGLARIYTYSDTFLLSILRDEVAVGYYSTPFKIAFAFQFIPLAFMGALYPAMSAVVVRDRAQVGALFVQAVRALFCIAIPIAAGIGILAEQIIMAVYGTAFLPSVVPLIVLIGALPFIFANFPAGYLLNACDRQSWNTGLIAVATVINTIANFILIPPWGATGAAIAATGSSIALFCMNLVVLRRAVSYRSTAILDAGLRMGAAALAMMGTVYVLHAFALPLRIGVGVLCYILALFMTRGVRGADLRALRDAFRRGRPETNLVTT
ncbi:oligosaccharide flippase family protein [Candidatus Uhrbacteria bacterium]|nr:oligosaccharide flippase family protein [Candidatus Uhrbacteria bacterium]